MITLRPYQLDYIEQCSEAFRTCQRIVLAAPTGAGKTAMFSEIVRRAAFKETPTLIVTDRTELFKQTWSALGRVNVTPQLIEPNNRNLYKDALVNVAMVETLNRRLAKGFEINPKLIIIDEAHMGSFNRLFEHFPNAKVIGATATPIGKQFYKYYQKIIQCTDVPELIEQGFLSPCKGYEMQDSFDDLEIKHGEFTEASQFNHFNKRKLYDGVLEKWQEVARNEKTIVFCVNIQHSINTYERFKEAGVNAAVVTSKTNEGERKAILEAYSKGYIQVLVNCGILTKGYDEPSITCVIMNRKTLSLPLWLQCAGRGGRTYPGKTHFTLLDFGQNFTEHGLWDEARQWKLEPPKKKKLIQREAPMKHCKQCDAVVAATARVCQWCDYIFEIANDQPSEGVLVEVKSKVNPNIVGMKIGELSIDELYELQKSGAYKPTFIWRIIRSKGTEAIEEYGKLCGYKHGWLMRQFEQISDNSFVNVTIKA